MSRLYCATLLQWSARSKYTSINIFTLDVIFQTSNEPVLSDAMFYSVPHGPKSMSLTLSDLFDIQHFNRMSESFGYSLMATREEFFTDAPKEAILMMKSPNSVLPRDNYLGS